MSRWVLILGATSGIARPLCQEMSKRGCNLILAGRNFDELEAMASDLRIRNGTQAHIEQFDALPVDHHAKFFDRCINACENQLDGVVLCYGHMSDQMAVRNDVSEACRTIDVNLTSAVSILSCAANYLEQRQSGFIAAISSVAGDRGRQSNYVYGASKAGLTVYLQGLRNRLFKSGVHVLTIKPGFVDTPMTEGLLNPKSPMVASPEQVARKIDKAIRRRKNVLYTPWFWWPIMKIIQSIPEPIFKRMRL